MAGCIAVLAHTGDALGQYLVETWPGGNARLMTPANLASWGLYWRLSGGVADPGSTGIGVDQGAVAGLLGLMDVVEPRDLPHVAPDDRPYVAAETTAFLSAWLHVSAFPKLNPPTLTSLGGERHPVVWRAHALACGLAAPEYVATSPDHGDVVGGAAIAVVGDWTFGGDARAAAGARALAAAARLPMLSVTLAETGDGFALLGASARPDLSDPETAESVAAWFAQRLA